jgi:hypothetical protein
LGRIREKEKMNTGYTQYYKELTERDARWMTG